MNGEFGAWTKPINVGPPLNTKYNDMYAILTADGLTVYFTSDRPGGRGLDDLWVSRRESTDEAWGDPENLAVLNSPSNDSLAVFSTSGNIMYFHSDRPGGCGTGDLWTSRAKRGGDVWTAPVNMGCVVNTESTEIAPAFYADDDQGPVDNLFRQQPIRRDRWFRRLPNVDDGRGPGERYLGARRTRFGTQQP